MRPRAREEIASTLIHLFDAVLPFGPEIERRKMFGYPAAFLNSHLFAGLHQVASSSSFAGRPREPDRRATHAHRMA